MATTATSAPPPLERVLPYIVSGVSAATTALVAFAGFLFSIASRSFSFFSPLPIILYICAPLIVFFDIVADIFIRWPHTIALYLLDAFYPIYVFCGVACIVGLLVGGTGRLVTQLLVNMVAINDKEEEKEVDEEAEAKAEVRRGKRRQKVAIEDDDD